MYLGWDIGIKNLAYCQIRKLDKAPDLTDTTSRNILLLSGNYYQIVDWDVVNIIPRVSSYIQQRGEVILQQRPVVKCKAILGPGCRAGRSGKKARSRPVSPAGSSSKGNGDTSSDPNYCGKTALACLSSDPTYDIAIPAHKHGYQGFCGTHLKRANLTTTEYLDSRLTNCWCHVVVPNPSESADAVKRCGTKAMYVDRKHYFRGYCKKHYNAVIRAETMTDKDFLKIVRGKSSTQLDITHLGTALFDELEKRPHLHQDSTCVLLENQPVLTNPTMKSVQMFVHSYFMDYGIRRQTGSVKEIHCYSASKKLDLIKHVPTEVYESIKTEAKTIPKKYGRHKRIAIRLCENFLGPNSPIGINCEDMYAKFQASKKRDDLADSLLMTLHYLEREHLKAMQNANSLAPLLRDTPVMSESQPLIDSGTDGEGDVASDISAIDSAAIATSMDPHTGSDKPSTISRKGKKTKNKTKAKTHPNSNTTDIIDDTVMDRIDDKYIMSSDDTHTDSNKADK